MAQTDIEIAAVLCRKYEGLYLKPYICPAGYATQGYGHLVKDTNVPTITKEQAEEWLQQDLIKFKTQLLAASPSLVYASTSRRAALIDFCFNLGTGRYRASTLKRKVDVGDWDGAIVEIKKWVNGGGRRLPGLVKRRNEEALLLAIEE